MAEIEIKTQDGKAKGKHKLAESFADVRASKALLHRAVVAEEANARQGTQQTKGRSQVRGGGRKPYRQKKTGRARQGSTRSPHYAHGAMALYLTPRDYDKKLNRKERRLAILGALNDRIESGDVTIAEKIVFAEPKTKQASSFLAALGFGEAKRVLVILPEVDTVTYKSFRNIPGVIVRTAPSNGNGDPASKTATFSARDLLVAHKIVIAQDAMKRIEEVWSV